MRSLLTLALAASALLAARAEPAAGGADGALWRWLTANGAAINYIPAFSESGLRGGVAVTDIPAGGLVRLPCSLEKPRARTCGKPHVLGTNADGVVRSNFRCFRKHRASSASPRPIQPAANQPDTSGAADATNQ
jgi:hypothetical protein